MNSLDFSVYIGGPMQAAVKRNTQPPSQVNFIQEVGFEDDGGTSKLRYVDFKLYKIIPNEAGDDFEDAEVNIKVPFLTMLTIPALRIEEM